MGLGREVDDRVVPGQHLAQQRRVGDIALHKTQSGIIGRKIGTVTGIGQQVENRHGGPGSAGELILQEGTDIGRSDETGTPGHENLHSW